MTAAYTWLEHLFYAGPMASGGYGRGSGIPLRDRVWVGGGAPASSPAVAALAAPSAGDPPARHCWVAVPVDGSRPRPGLLLEWRKVEHRWEGRVVYAAERRPGRWASVEEWLPAELLTGE